MKVLVDTDVLIRQIRESKSGRPTLLQHIVDELGADVFISATTRYELMRGVTLSNEQQCIKLLNSFDCLPLSVPIADRAALLFRELKQQHPHETSKFESKPHDVWIAATALEHNLILATHNQKDFKKYPLLPLLIHPVS